MIDIESLTSVFGVSWDSSQPSTALTRLTKANDPNKLVTVDITTEPVPAVGTGSGSSPFDSYMPWMGMEEVDIDASGRVYPANRTSPSSATCVKIPQFYYKVEKSGNIFRYYVADGPIDGFSLHPGSESYIARYEGYLVNKSGGQALCSYSNTPAKTGLTRAEFRNYAKILRPMPNYTTSPHGALLVCCIG